MDLSGVQLQGAVLAGAQLQEADLIDASLGGADLRAAIFSVQTNLIYAKFYDQHNTFVSVANTQWNGVNLAPLNWSPLLRGAVLGDDRKMKDAPSLSACEEAMRANRQLALALRAQGLNAEAAELDYRAHRWDPRRLKLQHRYLAAAASKLVDLVSGYGYRFRNSIAVYLFTIAVFAFFYWLIPYTVPGPTTYHWMHNVLVPQQGPATTHNLTFNDDLIMSVTSFHGRGFFPPEIIGSLGHGAVAAFEALIGLLIEVTLIATFTQRIFR